MFPIKARAAMLVIALAGAAFLPGGDAAANLEPASCSLQATGQGERLGIFGDVAAFHGSGIVQCNGRVRVIYVQARVEGGITATRECNDTHVCSVTAGPVIDTVGTASTTCKQVSASAGVAGGTLANNTASAQACVYRDW